MNNITTSILLLTAALAPCSAYAANPVAIGYGSAKESKDIVFTVSNPSDMARNEMVEIAEAPATPFLLMDARGHEVPYQITHDGKIIFRVSIPAKAGIDYKLVPGTPMPVDTICYGRIFPERKDDLAWENDRGAFRAYGPALQKSGEKAYGYDVWTKSVTEPVLEQRFYDDRVKRISFHIDHGKGMDVYAVGPTLGGGTSALLLPGDSIVMPYCWAEARVLDNGPLRFTAELTYNPVRIGGKDVIEHRLITLDAGDCLNKTTVWYDNLPADARPIAGIVVHDSNPQGYDFGNGFVTYTDYTQEPGANNGEIYLALCGDKTMKVRYIPFDAPRGDAVGHVILSAPEGADRMTYYWGSGWSKGFVPDAAQWNDIVRSRSDAIALPPLAVTFKLRGLSTHKLTTWTSSFQLPTWTSSFQSPTEPAATGGVTSTSPTNDPPRRPQMTLLIAHTILAQALPESAPLL